MPLNALAVIALPATRIPATEWPDEACGLTLLADRLESTFWAKQTSDMHPMLVFVRMPGEGESGLDPALEMFVAVGAMDEGGKEAFHAFQSSLRQRSDCLGLVSMLEGYATPCDRATGEPLGDRREVFVQALFTHQGFQALRQTPFTRPEPGSLPVRMGERMVVDARESGVSIGGRMLDA